MVALDLSRIGGLRRWVRFPRACAILLLLPALVACQATVTPIPTPTGYGGEGQIAFVSDRDGSLHIYVMNADGSQVRRLTDLAADYWAPSWSSDG
jgi:hypothetical protein